MANVTQTIDLLPESAAVVVVGGGAIGCSTAYHLTTLGVRDVVVLEQHVVSAGIDLARGGRCRAVPPEREPDVAREVLGRPLPPARGGDRPVDGAAAVRAACG